jgi:hypothetical protein
MSLAQAMPWRHADTAESAQEATPAQSTGKRFHMDLPPSSVQRLYRLKHITEASSFAEVIRNALRLYEALIEEVTKGKEILLRDKEGNTTVLRVF